MKTFYSLLIVSLISTNCCLAQWFWQNPLPSGNSLYKVQMISQEKGWAAGSCGTILKTTNSGINWNFQNISTNEYLQDIVFLNESIGIVVGNRGTIFKTSDGGSNWFQFSVGISNDLSKVSCTDNNHYFAVGSKGIILRTTNGGLNWSVQHKDSNYYFQTIKFVNESIGMMAGFRNNNSCILLKTTDGGNTWNELPFSIQASLKALYFKDENNVIAAGYGGRVLNTTNGGTNWSQQQCGDTITNLSDICFINSQTGFITGGYNSILKTINGGINWFSVPISMDNSFNSVSFSDEVNGVLVGEGIAKTTDGGNNWLPESGSATGYTEILRAVDFSDINHGIVYSGLFLKTTNGGTTWNRFENLPANYLNCFHFINSNTGTMAGAFGKIYKTTNEGVSWINQSVDDSLHNYFTSIRFANENTGYVAGYNGNIKKTTNGGLSWISKLSSVGYSLSSLCVPDADHCIVLGKPSTGFRVILSTTNGGENWSSQNVYINGSPLPALSFYDSNNGVLVGENEIKKTIDGGASWFSIYSNTNHYSFNAVSYLNLNSLVVAGQIGYGDGTGGGGIIMKTTNSGVNWVTQFTGTANTLLGISFSDPDHGTVVGYNGTILRTNNGGNVFVNQINTEIPDIFSLYQNYPNPFNPSTTIKFQLKEGSLADLKVYDVVGKEVAQLVNENLHSGSYSITWDASGLPSGVYFYKLETENFSETKKMILLK